MIKTIVAVALFSIAANAQTQFSTQNPELARAQERAYQRQEIAFQKQAIQEQRELTTQDRELLEAALKGLTSSQNDIAAKKTGVRFAKIVSGATAAITVLPVAGVLGRDIVAYYKGIVGKGPFNPEAFARSLSLKQIVVATTSIAVFFGTDQFNNLVVVAEESKWPEQKKRIQEQRESLVKKEQTLRMMEANLQTQIQLLAQ